MTVREVEEFRFEGENSCDDWNPHIVRKLHHYYLDCFDPETTSKIIEWIEKWNLAQSILGVLSGNRRVKPLAYRLETILSDPQETDQIRGSKFGGIPDFRHSFSFKSLYDKKFRRKLQKAGSDGLSSEPQQVIRNLWPRCGECGEHMDFLAGVDLSEWLLPIHLITYTQDEHPNNKTFQNSGLGYKDQMGTGGGPDRFGPFYQIFYCNQDHPKFDNPSFDARLTIEMRTYESEKLKEVVARFFPEKESLRGFDPETKIDLEEYRGEILDFMKKNGIGSSIPIQTLKGLELRFDLDLPHIEEHKEEWEWDLDERFPDIFGRSSTYQFFGRPVNERRKSSRYACQRILLDGRLRRMAPIISWCDEQTNCTRQIYGDLLGYYGSRGGGNIVYCKIDES